MNRIVRGRKDKRKLELIELAPEDIVPVGLAGAAIIGVQFVPVVTVCERLPVQRVKRAKKNDCCRDHPEPLKVDIARIRLSPNSRELFVSVSVGHACGILEVSAYIADLVPEPPDFVVQRVEPRLVNGRLIVGKVRPECNPWTKISAVFVVGLPIKDLVGTSFHVVVQADDCCGRFRSRISRQQFIA